ncbi:MAG: gamma-glutamylcyclotransferase family protein [Planctomycetota bacterium]|nr:gamma-glutamylcyclotransferase family protein [Planctomycetota bacterium]
MTRPYFAYGANLDRAAMARRCPGARVRQRAVLADHALVAMREGWLSIAPRPGSQVEGLLWELDPEHLIALDEYEEVASGLYVHEMRAVEIIDGTCVEALVYVGENAGPGRLHGEYADRVARAARAELGPAAAGTIEALAR